MTVLSRLDRIAGHVAVVRCHVAAEPARADQPPAPVMLSPSTDLASSTLPYLTAEELARFRQWGFVVKRGLIPKALLKPWIEEFWRTVSSRPDHFRDALRREEPLSWLDVGQRWQPWSDGGHGRDEIHLSGNTWRWHGLGHDPAFVADTSAQPAVLSLVGGLLGTSDVMPLKRPTRNRGCYSIFPTADASAKLSPHVDLQPYEIGGCTLIDDVAPGSGGFTVWPGSPRMLYPCTSHEFIPSPTADFGPTLEAIKQQVVPFEFVGGQGDVLLYHYLMVHSAGVNRSGDKIRMAAIQDFTRVKPKRCLMWGVDGATVTPNGEVIFPPCAAAATAAGGGVPEDETLTVAEGDRICRLLWHHDTIEWGPSQPTNVHDMWQSWSSSPEEHQHQVRVVDEAPWWEVYDVQLPTYNARLGDIASRGSDGSWRLHEHRV